MRFMERPLEHFPVLLQRGLRVLGLERRRLELLPAVREHDRADDRDHGADDQRGKPALDDQRQGEEGRHQQEQKARVKHRAPGGHRADTGLRLTDRVRRLDFEQRDLLGEERGDLVRQAADEREYPRSGRLPGFRNSRDVLDAAAGLVVVGWSAHGSFLLISSLSGPLPGVPPPGAAGAAETDGPDELAEPSSSARQWSEYDPAPSRSRPRSSGQRSASVLP